VYLTSVHVIHPGENEALYATLAEFVTNRKCSEQVFSEGLSVTVLYCSFYEGSKSITHKEASRIMDDLWKRLKMWPGW
jgi:hypothetical protein